MWIVIVIAAVLLGLVVCAVILGSQADMRSTRIAMRDLKKRMDEDDA